MDLPTAILDGVPRQVKVPTLVAGRAKSAGSLKAAVEQVHVEIPGSQLRSLEGQTHHPAAEPAAARTSAPRSRRG